VAGGRDLVSGFLKGAGFEVAMKVDSEFVLDKEGAQARAGRSLQRVCWDSQR
jgi:hypothetical protein